MALQVWLPLNGNVENRGLSNIIFTNYSGTNSISGKIGNCYTFSGTSGNGIYASDNGFMDTYINGKSFSICAWVKSSENAAPIVSLSYGLRLAGGSSPSFSLYNSSGSKYCYSNVATNDNKWHHVAGTYDVTSGLISIYIDGICTGTASRENYSSSWTNGLYIARDPNNSGSAAYHFQGSMNDVRIYNHCLSSKEVKEIAKGLLLHYKMDDGHVESTTNLYNGGLGPSDCYNGSNSKYGFNNDTDFHYEDGIFHGRYCRKVYEGTLRSTNDFYPYFSYLHPQSNGAYRTLSFDLYPTQGSTLTFYTYGGSGTVTSVSNGIGGYGTSVPIKTNQWNHLEITIQSTSSSTSGFGYAYFGEHTANNNYWLFANVQVEEKDHATPYTTTSRSETTVYDCSGFGYNGTANGTLITSSNTSRYNSSLSFNGSDSAITIGNFSTMVPDGNFTFNCWFHKDSWGSKGYETIFGGPSGFELEAKSSSTNSPVIVAYSWGGGSKAYSLNTWNMITMVRTTSSCLFYLNGELCITGTAGTIPSGNYFIGAWNSSTQQNYKGSISDVRIYATPLSAEDVKELYSTSAVICDNSTVMAYSLEE